MVSETAPRVPLDAIGDVFADDLTGAAERLDKATLAVITRAITNSGRYQLVRRFEPPGRYHAPDGTATKTALFVDVETTGKDPARDRIIQLACAQFTFDSATGRIFEVGPCESWLEDPGVSIPEEITALTGVSDADVAGKRIDESRVRELVDGAVLIIAHNAWFDRRFCERRLAGFEAKHWACSMADVPWEREGLGGAKLAWLAYRQCGVFYDEHHADADCLVGIHLLTTTLPKSGEMAMQALLRAARGKSVRIWAMGADRSTSDRLRARGYRWSKGPPYAWWKDVNQGDVGTEEEWLREEVYVARAGIPVTRSFDGRLRYSDRVDAAMRP